MKLGTIIANALLMIAEERYYQGTLKGPLEYKIFKNAPNMHIYERHSVSICIMTTQP